MLISLILRALAFWIREPLVIAVSLFFTGLALCWFVMAGGWARGGTGPAFLAAAALRFHLLRREWRSRQAAREAV
ncbi:hypothetical protein [Streptomyces sp. NPDC058086]|uniref:hypothetical protein n=1 Tax=Streptomyces sp. NPDC058086 TaxID=3346334 RepID=UPI0036EF5529